jgi:hypothetical protein
MAIVISAALAKSRLARSVQRGDPPERIAEWRDLYYAARARDYLHGLIAADRLRPEHRAALADLLNGGDRDVAA